ncbi:hypothetical protein F4803DRAFT_534902 [Xylaria telfairii]|nr:hypothetical protein F4803DRAFT_534902 [Xylaria telfairii]
MAPFVFREDLAVFWASSAEDYSSDESLSDDSEGDSSDDSEGDSSDDSEGDSSDDSEGDSSDDSEGNSSDDSDGETSEDSDEDANGHGNISSNINALRYNTHKASPSIVSFPTQKIPQSKLIGADKLWASNKYHLYVCFMNGSTEQQNLVKDVVEKHYNSLRIGIHFAFLPMNERNRSDIRLEFSNESWSCLGKDAQAHPFEKTMTINMYQSSMKIQADILHEFGHALGMPHAHKHPDFKGDWNHPKVAPRWGWSIEKYRHAVDKDTASVVGKIWDLPYDPHSIMHYPIYNGDTYSGVTELPLNTVLSDGDKKWLLRRYPNRREGRETGKRTESRLATSDRSTYTRRDTPVPVPGITRTIRRDKKKSVVSPQKKTHEYKSRECIPVYVTGNNSATVQGGHVRVSGNAMVTVQGGGRVVVSENGRAIVYGDSDARVSGNGSVYVYGNGTAVVSENGSARFSGRGTGKTSDNGTLRSYV